MSKKNHYITAEISEEGVVEFYIHGHKIPGIIDISIDQDMDYAQVGIARVSLDLWVNLKSKE